MALATAAYGLPTGAVILEIGSFLGKSAVLLAGARRLRGTGIVHCVDPFDGSGDEASVPSYDAIAKQSLMSLRERFDENIRRAALDEWVVVHQGTAEQVASGWAGPIDMLFLDGDQSPDGARSAYSSFAPFLKLGGILAAHNSSERVYAPGHDGHRRVVVETVHPPEYSDVYCVESTSFARKVG